MNSEQNNRTDAFMSGKAFDITFRYIDDVLSINIPNKCKICKKQTYSAASSFDIYLNLDTYGEHPTSLCCKRDHFNFAIINFPHLDSNIPITPSYGVYISQPILYS